jgi:transposase
MLSQRYAYFLYYQNFFLQDCLYQLLPQETTPQLRIFIDKFRAVKHLTEALQSMQLQVKNELKPERFVTVTGKQS